MCQGQNLYNKPIIFTSFRIFGGKVQTFELSRAIDPPLHAEAATSKENQCC